ncbi:MAG: peptidoglycan DD-metalloendopeptidase family protein [Flavobacteriales bacterium]|nr:peptidoglycan DD-metalloendopeptidase family protein [Flavobacteriales bacterium]
MINIKPILITLGIIISFGLSAQKRSDQLKLQEKKLINKIANTKLLIKETKNSEKLTLTDISIINHQIYYREKLISNYNFQLRKLDENIHEINRQIISLENTIGVLKEEYQKMLMYAFKNRNPNYKYLYIISSSSFSEAFHRMKYIQHYADYRKKQIERILKNQIDLAIEKELLSAEIEKKSLLVETKKSEKENYLNDKKTQEVSLKKLKENEDILVKQLNEQSKKRKKISSAIRKAIEKEVRSTIKESKTASFSLTPEGMELSKSFNSNKGRLCWPVERGEISSKYGKHRHHLVSTATVENNGIDIVTTKNANVRAIFGGKVTSVLIIPGAGKVIMVSHGEYRTVYANLQEVFVKKGELLSAKQNIGKLLINEEGVSESHLEIWKIASTGMSTVNPSLWLSK